MGVAAPPAVRPLRTSAALVLHAALALASVILVALAHVQVLLRGSRARRGRRAGATVDDDGEWRNNGGASQNGPDAGGALAQTAVGDPASPPFPPSRQPFAQPTTRGAVREAGRARGRRGRGVGGPECNRRAQRR